MNKTAMVRAGLMPDLKRMFKPSGARHNSVVCEDADDTQAGNMNYTPIYRLNCGINRNHYSHITAMRIQFFLTFILCCIFSSIWAVGGDNAGITGLRCEHLVNPLGIDNQAPRLSWQITTGKRGARQSAYRILVASSPDVLAQGRGDLWDSGEVKSERSHLVVYKGRRLSSHQLCFWKVRVWDANGRPLPWSPPARWTMGILSPEQWQTHWIAAESHSFKAESTSETRKLTRLPIFRREFHTDKRLRRAVVSICGLGHYELYLNGGKVGDRLLDPPWTNYRKTCLYATYEITRDVRRGVNTLGVILGNGMYNVIGGRYTKFKGSFGQPQFILHLRLEYADGSIERVVSDESWRVTEGPITFSCVYGGEDWDARYAPEGWLKAGFDDSKWWPVLKTHGPGGTLRTTSQQPVKTMQVFKPVKMAETDRGVAIDFGQNSAAIPVVRLQGPSGASVRIRTGEGPGAGGWNNTWFAYTLKGDGEEVFRPRFTSWGFRSIIVEGATLNTNAVDKPVVLSAKALSIRCSAPPAGSFACSDELINKIYRIVHWSIHSNFQSVLTDCPHREKLGWLEVSYLMGPSIHFSYDAAGFFTKILNDCAEAQQANGLIPDIAPEFKVFRGGFRDSPEWGSAFIINPYFLYLWTGDDAPITKHYEAMKHYLAYLRSRTGDGILSYGLGDWMPREKTPTPLVATAIYYHDLVLMTGYAEHLNKHEDAKALLAEAEKIKESFNTHFLQADTGTYAGGTQCAQGMALTLGLVPSDCQAQALQVLVENGKAKNFLTAGDVGNRYAILSFAAAGAHELLYNISTKTYGIQARQPDRTTLAEAWQGGASQNHCMLGHILEWYHGWLAGIRPDPAGPGFKRTIIDPHPIGNLSWVKAHHDSPYGRIAVHWRREGTGLHLDVTIPPNTSATVYVPARTPSDVTEGGLPIDRTEGVGFLRMENGRAVFNVDSGHYKFISKEF